MVHVLQLMMIPHLRATCTYHIQHKILLKAINSYKQNLSESPEA